MVHLHWLWSHNSSCSNDAFNKQLGEALEHQEEEEDDEDEQDEDDSDDEDYFPEDDVEAIIGNKKKPSKIER